MSAVELLKAGKLQEALQSLQQEVRQNAADSKLRVFLFQLLAVLGQWDRALTQLNVVGDLDGNAMPMVHSYREALRCEVLRQEVFSGKRSPVVFGEPEPWIAQLLEALHLGVKGDFVHAQQMREQAFADAPLIAGQIDGQPFAWLADADQRLGPIFELFAKGCYYFLPMHRVRSLRIEAPTDLRDQVWMPVGVQLTNGGELVGFMPTRYPDTVTAAAAADDDALLLSRRTDWVEAAPDFYLGMGQRMFATDQADYPLMEARVITFDHPDIDAKPQADEPD